MSFGGIYLRPLADYSHRMRTLWSGLLIALGLSLLGTGGGRAADLSLFARTNLMAWCIVPFDAKKRGPEERAAMLDRLELRQLAYDWRDEHLPTFEDEVRAMQGHGIAITAWWFPGTLDTTAQLILKVIERHRLQTQLWVTGGGEPTPTPEARRSRVEAEANRLEPIAREAARRACRVGLYNHGGWFGEPENQVRIIERLRQSGITNVGIVYNFHHGHTHLARFPELLTLMKPHLIAVNLNGMIPEGEARGAKILHLAEGDQELGLMRQLLESGWRGPVGILDHRPETDSEMTLQKNLQGLDWLLRELERPGSGGPRPLGLATGSPARSAP